MTALSISASMMHPPDKDVITFAFQESIKKKITGRKKEKSCWIVRETIFVHKYWRLKAKSSQKKKQEFFFWILYAIKHLLLSLRVQN